MQRITAEDTSVPCRYIGIRIAAFRVTQHRSIVIIRTHRLRVWLLSLHLLGRQHCKLARCGRKNERKCGCARLAGDDGDIYFVDRKAFALEAEPQVMRWSSPFHQRVRHRFTSFAPRNQPRMWETQSINPRSAGACFPFFRAASPALSRQMLGATNPLQAAAGTIRGDLCTNTGDPGPDAPCPVTSEYLDRFATQPI